MSDVRWCGEKWVHLALGERLSKLLQKRTELCPLPDRRVVDMWVCRVNYLLVRQMSHIRGWAVTYVSMEMLLSAPAVEKR